MTTPQTISKAKMISSTWRPSDRPSEYCVTYAAFYEAEPVASGAALCLVYDLLTTTPGEVPQYGWSAAIQRSIDVALEDYFHAAPASLIKRVKIGDDAWRTINAFAAQRHFAYLVQGDSFETLQGNDGLVAENLAAFCAHNGGQYVLYHARVLCSRYSKELSEYDSDFDDGNPMRPRDIVENCQGELRKTDVCHTFALVVQPALIDTTQIAQLLMEDVFTRLRSLLPHARDEALRYARQVVSHKPTWTVDWRNERELTEFVSILLEIDDRGLFQELLLSLNFYLVDIDGALLRGIDHFGWPIVEPAQVEPVVDALLSLQPWTEMDVHHDRYYFGFECRLGGDDFSRLVVLVNESFPTKLLAVVTVRDMEVMTRFVVPSLE